MINRIRTVAVFVNDQRKAIDFYVNKLGFELVLDLPGGYGEGENTNWIEVAPAGSATHIALTPAAFMGRKAGGPAACTLECADANATVTDLKAKGVEISKELTTEFWGTHFEFKDPDGNVFMVSEANSAEGVQ